MQWYSGTFGDGGAGSPGGGGGGPQTDTYEDVGFGATGDSGGVGEDGVPNSLSAVRHLRKQAQNDAQLLLNRIALLKVSHSRCTALPACPPW